MKNWFATPKVQTNLKSLILNSMIYADFLQS